LNRQIEKVQKEKVEIQKERAEVQKQIQFVDNLNKQLDNDIYKIETHGIFPKMIYY
jgi:uncharacterized protein YeeX (DUF496 family)